MAIGAKATDVMRNVLFNRAFKASPDYTVYSKGSIGTGTTTPAISDTALETVITNWNGGASNYKDYETNYPTFDEVTQKVTTRVFVTANDANANVITEFGDFNTDGTPAIGGRFVFNGITKTSAIQVYFTITYRLI